MYAASALRLKLGPVMPGEAAFASSATSRLMAHAARQANCRGELFTVMVSRMFPLLAAGFRRGIDRVADVHFGHQPAEVLRIVRQVIEVRRVEIELLSGAVSLSVEDHVERLAAAEG